jgi:PAS domain S-box-containing protein
MDYLVFMIGLFLLAAGAGCIFLFREHRQLSRWPLLGGALTLLAFKEWFGIASFALGLGDSEILVNALLGAVYATALLGFCLSPLIDGPRKAFVLKWAAMVGCFGLTFINGIGNLESRWFIIPIIVVSCWAGWKISRFRKAISSPAQKSVWPIATALLLTFITAVCLHPRAVAISYDILGQGHSAARVLFLVALAAAAVASIALCIIVWSAIYQKNRGQLTRNLLFRRKIGTSVIVIAAAITTVNGAWLANWLGSQVQMEQTSTFLSALRLGADNFDPATIAKIQGREEEIKSVPFNVLRTKLLSIRNALPGSRFTYLLGMRNQQLVFLADAEEPSNTETFSPPGEPVKDYPARWQPELAGKATFSGPDRDEWGVWFSAAVPIWGPNQRVAAILGVDYPAATWLQPLAGRRLAAMGVTLSVALLLIALFSIHLISIETAWRVEGLSERLSDAMIAAGFDTWECFPRPFRLNVGERIAATLGWNDTTRPSFRRLWKQIHPEDRYQLFNLIRPSKTDPGGSSEREVRLMDGSGRWVWFMLRGRLIRSNHEEATRMVGTVLNIDERQRTRLEIDRQSRFAQHVMESVPNGLAVIDDSGVLSYANPAFIRLARGGAKSLVGRSIDSLISIENFEPKANEGFDATLTCLDGASVPIQVFRAPLSESRQNSGSILAIVDLTAAKASEQDLLRSRAEANRLALVAKRTDNAVVITDALGHIEWVNEGFTKISGYTKEEVVGKSPGSILQRVDCADPARDHMRECIQSGKGFDTEIVNYGKDGRAYIVHIECQPLVDSRGTLTGFMAIERDVTESRRSSSLLEAVASISTTLLSKRIQTPVWGEILAALGSAANVDRCHLSQIQTDPTTRKQTLNRIATWKADPTLAQNQIEEAPNISFDPLIFDRWHREMSTGNEISGVVRSFPVKEQATLLAQGVRSLIAVPIFASGELWGFLGFDACQEDRVWQSWEISILRSAAANIGLRQVAQSESDALVLARDEARSTAIAAEKANRAKSTFLATMSHEIRTPLNAVIGMASLLETTSLNGQQLDYASTILSSSNFLLDLINDILDYSRIESGKIDLDSNPFTLSDLCRETCDVIRMGASGKDIELIGRVAPHLPARFQGDPSRIRQILINLVSNAVKFTSGGFVSLTVDGNLTPDGRWNLTFEVHDTGIGIAPDALDRLFQPFVQEDSSTTRRFGGSGLGLAISKRLSEIMGGDITVTSTQGKGSTFFFNVTLQPTTGEISVPKPAEFLPGTALSILVVDDNELNRRVLEENLAAWGLPCDTADSAAEAIRLWASSGPYDVVLTDHHMPDMDGVEMTRYFRSLPAASRSRFVLIGSETIHDSATKELFDEIGVKPVWAATLLAIFSRLFPGTVRDAPPVAKAPADFDSTSIENLRVLIAEDNANNQKVVRLLLRRLGIEPDIVDNGENAVEATAATDYDVIFLDLQMPVMDGLEASRRIRALNHSKRPYIVALTANVFQENRDAATAAGMDDYLSKPITLDRLRDKFSAISKNIVSSDHIQPAMESPPVLAASPVEMPARSQPEPAKPVTAHAGPLIDFRQLKPLAALGIEDFLDLLGDVIQDVPAHLEKVRVAIHTDDQAELKSRAHAFRGMVANYGCIALAQRLTQLEYHDQVTSDQATAIHTELLVLWENSLAAIHDWQKTVPELANS